MSGSLQFIFEIDMIAIAVRDSYKNGYKNDVKE